MFGKEKSTWEELSGIFTAQEIYQQPATWAKTIAQIKNEKEALKKFMEPVLSDPDCDIVFTGAGTSEYVGNALYSYVNRYTGYHAKSYASTDLVETPENYLSRNKKTLLVNFGRSGNSPESVGSVQVADEVCKENVYHLFITCNKDGALAKAAATRDNAYDINLTPETHDQSFHRSDGSHFDSQFLWHERRHTHRRTSARILFNRLFLRAVVCFGLHCVQKNQMVLRYFLG